MNISNISNPFRLKPLKILIRLNSSLIYLKNHNIMDVLMRSRLLFLRATHQSHLNAMLDKEYTMWTLNRQKTFVISIKYYSKVFHQTMANAFQWQFSRFSLRFWIFSKKQILHTYTLKQINRHTPCIKRCLVSISRMLRNKHNLKLN